MLNIPKDVNLLSVINNPSPFLKDGFEICNFGCINVDSNKTLS